MPDMLYCSANLYIHMARHFDHSLQTSGWSRDISQQNTFPVFMQKTDKSEKKDEVFMARKLEKCQSEESKKCVTSQFLGENLTLLPKLNLKISRSLSPIALKRTILSLPSSRHNSTSSSSLTLSPRQKSRHSQLRSLDTIFGFGQAGATSSSSSPSRPSSPFRLSFLGQIYRQHLEQRDTNNRESSSKHDT